MKRKLLYACYASSDYYARETGISMIGFFENNSDYEPEEIFILDYGILPQNKGKLDSIAKKYNKYITYLPAKSILEEIQHQLNLQDFRGSLATYSRAFIDKILPDYVERLLYIDSDTVVAGSVSELKYLDMPIESMATVISSNFSYKMQKGYWTLYTHNKYYYQCGVVLFDLTNWRNRNCYERITNILSIKKVYPCADQTLINNALDDSFFCKLPLKFNYISHIYSTSVERGFLRRGRYYADEEIYDAINKPSIIHYPGSPINRPWYDKCYSRQRDIYYLYKSMSPWANDKPMSTSDYYKQSKKLKNWPTYLTQLLEKHSPSYSLLMLYLKVKELLGICMGKQRNEKIKYEGIE